MNNIEEKKIERKVTSKPWFHSVMGILLISLLFGFFIFWRTMAGKVNIENSSITAPIIDLSPTTTGILQEIYVKNGDIIEPNTPVAKVGGETIVSKVSGIIVNVKHQEGQFFAPGAPVVSMINQDQERVVGKIDEDKGLKNIKVGDIATFTVDAFDGKEYKGIVDEISSISDQSGVLFSISDKREIKQFDIKVRFNVQEYPEIKEGMSAKITVYTK